MIHFSKPMRSAARSCNSVKAEQKFRNGQLQRTAFEMDPRPTLMGIQNKGAQFRGKNKVKCIYLSFGVFRRSNDHCLLEVRLNVVDLSVVRLDASDHVTSLMRMTKY